jgi:phosphate transport system protein
MDNLRQTFSEELKRLEEDLTAMSQVTVEMLEGSIKALIDKDVGLADRVVEMDDIVDDYNFSIEKKCLELIALQQPMGKDLRMIASILKVITDVERVGDYTVDLAKFSKHLAIKTEGGLFVDIPRMATIVVSMLKEVVRAFINKDLDLITTMIHHDEEVDRLFKQYFDELVTTIEKNPNNARRAMHHLMICRYLERIADHITNIGERTYYIETGEMKELHQ